jgi:hypothetical protein
MKCETVGCHDATASSFVTKVRSEVFANFNTVTVHVTVVCRIDCLACQDEFSVNNPFGVKKNYEHALDLFFTCLPFFSLGEFGLSLYGSCFLSQALV